MKFTEIEIKEVEKAANQVERKEALELNESQLALVGGGIGDVIVG
jgi:hypothetical protein